MNLPSDVVEGILSYLPVKSLGRFKVVCKDWYTHIQSKSFIAKHIKNQIGNPKLLVHHHEHLGENRAISICSEEEKQYDDNTILFHQQQQYFIKHMPPEHLKNHNGFDEIDIIGTCNGIVCVDYSKAFDYTKAFTCVSTYDKLITLWNPATKEFNTLPPFQLQSPPGTRICSDHAGFGFDSTTDDYKVIRMLCFGKEGSYREQEEYIMQMKIYSLSTNSWREFDCSGLSAKINCGNSSLILENKFCLLASNICGDIKSDEMFILSFDMGKEVFQKTPLPLPLPEPEDYSMELFQMHNSLALVIYHIRYDKMTLKIWYTKDLDQGCSSWIKSSSIVRISERKWPVGFWKCNFSNDLLFIFSSKYLKYLHGMDRVCMNNQGQVGVYMNNQGQISNNRLIKIKIKNSIIVITRQVFTYVETLVSVNRS